MDINEALVKILEDAGIRNIYSVKGKVVSVDEGKRTCDVEPNNNEANYLDVKLQSSESGDTGVVFIPEKDSDVIVHFLADDEAFVTKTSKISKFILKINETEFVVTDKLISLISDDLIEFKTKKENLKAIIADLITAIKLITVTTPSGPSGTPINSAQFTAINDRLKNLLK